MAFCQVCPCGHATSEGCENQGVEWRSTHLSSDGAWRVRPNVTEGHWTAFFLSFQWPGRVLLNWGPRVLVRDCNNYFTFTQQLLADISKFKTGHRLPSLAVDNGETCLLNHCQGAQSSPRKCLWCRHSSPFFAMLPVRESCDLTLQLKKVPRIVFHDLAHATACCQLPQRDPKEFMS